MLYKYLYSFIKIEYVSPFCRWSKSLAQCYNRVRRKYTIRLVILRVIIFILGDEIFALSPFLFCSLFFHSKLI